jgi:hypothetical protein
VCLLAVAIVAGVHERRRHGVRLRARIAHGASSSRSFAERTPPSRWRWIASDDRLAVLNELHKRAVFDQKR